MCMVLLGVHEMEIDWNAQDAWLTILRVNATVATIPDHVRLSLCCVRRACRLAAVCVRREHNSLLPMRKQLIDLGLQQRELFQKV
jgi:hypothetical protein